MPIDEFIIWMYCCVDRHLSNVTSGHKLRSRGFPPALSDSEVITMELVGEFLGIDTDKGIWQYFKNHWRHFFPTIGSRANFAKQAANLWHVKQLIQERILCGLGSVDEALHIIDGFPMPVCHFRRAKRSRIFRDVQQATYGYCASKNETYYGFEGHIVITKSGVITGYTVTKPNIERQASFDCVRNIEGLLLGDKGYIGDHYSEELKIENIQISAPSRKNMADDETPGFRKYLNNTRRRVETVIGQLVERFSISKVRARDIWHLTTRIVRKILSHTLAMALLREHDLGVMSLDNILSTEPKVSKM